MLPSVTPVATRIARIRLKHSAASAADRTSGWLTISMSGTPLRLKSSAVVAIRIGERLVQRLAGVLFEVDADDPDPARVAARLELEHAVGGERPIVLGDLVALRQVGIEIVLPREDRGRMHRAAERQSGLAPPVPPRGD